MRKAVAISLMIIMVSTALGAYFYAGMPEQMASHWNYGGQVDGYISRFWGIFLMPLVSFAMLGLFLVLPKIDPLGKNIEKFRKYYDMFILIMVAFLTYVYGLTLAWNLGYNFDMGLLVVPAVALLLFYARILMENAKRNWFIGIRTPWTLSSDRVWDKTHKLGAKLFKAMGVVVLLALLLPIQFMPLVMIPIGLASIYMVVYSYLEYKKEKK